MHKDFITSSRKYLIKNLEVVSFIFHLFETTILLVSTSLNLITFLNE